MGTKRDTLLIVDDQEVNRAALQCIFDGTYNLLEAENGEQALLLIGEYRERLAAMLLDIVMPVMDGYQVMEEAGRRGYLQELPVVVITAESSAENEVRIFDLGASEIIAKPFEPHVVLRRVQNIVDLNLRKLDQRELIEQQAARLRESNAVMIDALSSIIEYRSLETGQHIRRIGLFTRTLLEDVAKSYPEYPLDERKVALIASASSLHDIGKIAVPDAILNKPGRLTPAEYAVMKTHAAKGSEMLTTLRRVGDQSYLRYAYNICRYHHERWDGGGYPEGLRGDAIPICAQAVGLADCYDALTNDRVYKKAIPPQQAVNMILNGECGAFSLRLLESLKHVESRFFALSAQYTDTAPGQADAAAPAPTAGDFRDLEMLDTRQMAQLKYFTLLRQMNSTVLEVDFNTGVYHAVYLADEGFAPLRSGRTFEESFRSFVAASVHPEDRAMALEGLGDYLSSVFEQGLMKRSRKYRVFCSGTGLYRLYTVSLLRIDMEIPHQRRALILWQEASEGTAAPHPAREDETFHHLLQTTIGSMQRCRVDRWFTLEEPAALEAFLGYAPGELGRLFHNRYLELIYPEDRAEVVRQFREQFNQSSTIELEYRLIGKNGQIRWVLDKSQYRNADSGEPYLYFVLIDITQSRKTQQELRLVSERYRLLLEQSNDVLVDWDVRQDLLDVSDNWKARFGYEPIRSSARMRLTQASHLHPDDTAQVAAVFDAVRAGKAPAQRLELRIADAGGRYRWYRLRLALQSGEDGRIARVLGILSDINEEKQAAQALQNEADRDFLTGLYNRKAAMEKGREIIAGAHSARNAAMLLFDLDRFKQVNDRYGHLYGDELLKCAAAEFRRQVRGEDIVARVGGDEFLVLLREVPDRAAAMSRARQLAQALQDAFGRMEQDIRPSCCAGVSLCPQDGTEFNELFLRSDIALYRAKAGGRARIECYDAAAMGNDFSRPDRPFAAGTRIDSEEDRPAP